MVLIVIAMGSYAQSSATEPKHVIYHGAVYDVKHDDKRGTDYILVGSEVVEISMMRSVHGYAYAENAQGVVLYSDGKEYPVHIGVKGGHYIVLESGKKVYVKGYNSDDQVSR